MNLGTLARVCALLGLLTTAAINSQAIPSGSLDITFNGNGKVTTQIGGMNFDGNAVVVQTDGKIVVAGSVSTNSGADLAVVRYNANGSLDPAFNGTGLVTTNINDVAVATAAAVQTDGKILVAGYCINGPSSYDFAIVRYDANGALDPSFGVARIAVVDIDSRPDFANALALQPDGKIIVAGSARFAVSLAKVNGGGGETQQSDFAVIRLNADGSLDSAFGNSGIVTVNVGSFSDEATAVAIQTDGKIVVAGVSAGNGLDGEDFSLLRFDSDGVADPTFGMGGVVTTPVGLNTDRAQALAIQTDGKIVVAGYGTFATGSDLVVARYNADGSLDASFDGDGIVSTHILGNDAANAVRLQTDGKIVVAGSANGSDFAVVRYLTNGALDPSWGTAGVVTTDFGAGDDKGKALAIQADGKVVVAGQSNGRIALARYLGTSIQIPGELDPAFDTDGKETTCCGQAPGQSVALQADGKIVVAGITRDLTNFRFQIWLVRYNPNGGLDTTFGVGGEVRTNTADDIGEGGHVVTVIQPGGKIIVAHFSSGAYGFGTFVFRYDTSGALDPTFGKAGVANLKGSFYADVYLVTSLALQTDGRLLLGVRYHEDVPNSPIVTAFGVIRLSVDGALDATFGNNGFAYTPSLLGNAQSHDIPTGIAVQPDGKVVESGFARRNDGSTMFGVVRFEANGSLDPTFDGDGIVTTQIGISGDRDEPYSLGIQVDGKIVVAGLSRDNNVFESLAIVRYNANGSLDTGFDGDGKVMTATAPATAERLIIQPNGKIVVAGTSSDFVIVRYNADGSLDGSSLWGSGGTVVTDFGGFDRVNSLALQDDGKIVAAGSSGVNIAVARYIGEFAAPAFVTNSLPDGISGHPYNPPITASGGTAPYTFMVVSGALPNGLTLNSDGTWSGAPTMTGTFDFTVEMMDSTQFTQHEKVGRSDGSAPLLLAPNTAFRAFQLRILAPTSANVSIRGRVLTADGIGIKLACVSLTDQSGISRTALSNAYGYYGFDEVPVGEVYVITVTHKRYQFTNSAQVLPVLTDIPDLILVADP